MSRTLRRTDRPNPEWVGEKVWEKVENYNYKILVKATKKQRVAAIKKYHSDKHWVSIPSWFRKSINKRYRTRMNQEVNKINKTGDYDNYLFTPNHNNVRWEWW